MRVLMAVAVGTLLVQAASDTTYGSGVTLEQATKIEAILAAPADFVGKTVRVDGVATAVCAHMGCWMAVAPAGNPSGATLRLKVDDGVIVFPMSAKGKRVSAQGVVEVVAGAEAKEAAGEHAKADPRASTQYQLKAAGAIVRGE